MLCARSEMDLMASELLSCDQMVLLLPCGSAPQEPRRLCILALMAPKSEPRSAPVTDFTKPLRYCSVTPTSGPNNGLPGWVQESTSCRALAIFVPVTPNTPAMRSSNFAGSRESTADASAFAENPTSQ